MRTNTVSALVIGLTFSALYGAVATGIIALGNNAPTEARAQIPANNVVPPNKPGELPAGALTRLGDTRWRHCGTTGCSGEGGGVGGGVVTSNEVGSGGPGYPGVLSTAGGPGGGPPGGGAEGFLKPLVAVRSVGGVGRFVFGLVEAFGQSIPGSGSVFANAIAFGLMVLVLVTRPQGLMGRLH